MTVLDKLNELGEHEETIIWIKVQPFIVTRASDNDVDRITKGIMLD